MLGRQYEKVKYQFIRKISTRSLSLMNVDYLIQRISIESTSKIVTVFVITSMDIFGKLL